MTLHLPFTLVKISRFAERFWLRDLRRDDKGKWTGRVANELQSAPYQCGERIEFTDEETADIQHITLDYTRAISVNMLEYNDGQPRKD